MKLILTSKKAILDNLEKNIKEVKLLFIPPGKATKEDLYSDKYQKRIIEHGFSSKQI